MKRRWCWLCMFLTVASASTQAGQLVYVSERFTGEIRCLKDANGDGDALDIGESRLWADGLAEVVDLALLEPGLFAVDRGRGRIVVFSDRNRDGDALDVGEVLVWADGLSDAFGIGVTQAGELLVTESTLGRVMRLVDLNSDGDALDVGEKTLYADGISGAISVKPIGDCVFVAASGSNRVRRLIDLNGDGDALDVGENLAYTPPTIMGARGLLPDDASGVFFVSAYDANVVFRVEDQNGDGDAFDVGEVVRYADAVIGEVNGPWNMQSESEGGYLLAEHDDNEITLVRDLNGDGDALDVGEVIRFADGITGPVSLVALEDCNDNDGGDTIDIATGISLDIDFNGIPDECECATELLGDLDNDHSVAPGDIPSFVDCLLRGPAVQLGCYCGDMNQDKKMTGHDIQLFVDAILGGG